MILSTLNFAALAHRLQDFLKRRRFALDPAQRIDASDNE
jgi:hypothetical protein